MTTQLIVSTAGSGTWVVPPGVTSVSVICIGGGGAGGNNFEDQNGGGGGAYAANPTYAVTPGASIPYVVGAGGTGTIVPGPLSGSATTFNTTGVVADYGRNGTTSTPGVGGAVANCTGTVKHKGGDGGDGSVGGSFGGGGGSSGGSGSDGNAGGSSTSGTAGAAVAAGGAGGAGGNGGHTAGFDGSAPGGGGGGTFGAGTRGVGGAGYLQLDWTLPDVVVPIYQYHARQKGEAMWYLRQSTASQEIPLGPFVDAADGVTPMTALSIANTDIKLQKDGSTTQASKNSGGGTHIANGNYYAVLDATDTNTIGNMRVSVYMSGAMPVWIDCLILHANVYDVQFGSTAPSTLGSTPAVNVTQWLGSACATPPVAGVPTVNVKTWNNLTTAALPLTPTVAGTALDVNANGEAGIDWANIGGASTTNVFSGTTVGTATVLTNLPAAPTNWLDAASVKADAVAKIGAGTVDLTTSGHATAGTFGAAILAAAGGGSVDLGSILGTPLTETSAGYLALAFKHMYDVASPVMTVASINQSGDVYPKVDAEVASILSGVTTLLAVPSSDVYVCRYGGAFTSTAGSEVRVSVWLEKNGQAQVLASGTATVAFREHGAGANLFSVSTSSVTAQGIFELTKTTPGFTSDRLQVASITITDGVDTWVTREPVPIAG